MVSKILNPLTGRMINSHSITAKMLIQDYQIGGIPAFSNMISRAINLRKKIPKFSMKKINLQKAINNRKKFRNKLLRKKKIMQILKSKRIGRPNLTANIKSMGQKATKNISQAKQKIKQNKVVRSASRKMQMTKQSIKNNERFKSASARLASARDSASARLESASARLASARDSASRKMQMTKQRIKNDKRFKSASARVESVRDSASARLKSASARLKSARDSASARVKSLRDSASARVESARDKFMQDKRVQKALQRANQEQKRISDGIQRTKDSAKRITDNLRQQRDNELQKLKTKAGEAVISIDSSVKKFAENVSQNKKLQTIKRGMEDTKTFGLGTKFGEDKRRRISRSATDSDLSKRIQRNIVPRKQGMQLAQSRLKKSIESSRITKSFKKLDKKQKDLANKAQIKVGKKISPVLQRGKRIKESVGRKISPITNPIKKAISPVTIPIGIVTKTAKKGVKNVAKAGMKGVENVAKTGLGTSKRSLKITQDASNMLVKSAQSTTDMMRNIAQSARSATSASVVGKAKREIDKVRVKRSADPRNIRHVPGDLFRTSAAINKAMFGSNVNLMANKASSINKKTKDMIKSPFGKKKNKKQDLSKSKPKIRSSISSSRNQSVQKRNENQVSKRYKKERETKSQGEIAIDSLMSKAKDAMKTGKKKFESFEEHRKFLRKDSSKNTRRNSVSDDNSNKKIIVQRIIDLIKSSTSDNKNDLKKAVLTLSQKSNQNFIEPRVFNELKQLIGLEKIKMLKNLRKSS